MVNNSIFIFEYIQENQLWKACDHILEKCVTSNKQVLLKTISVSIKTFHKSK